MSTPARPPVLTIGHSTHAIGDFIALLRSNSVEELADIRTIPGSRRNPQFNADTLSESLKAAGISYIHLAGLGGLRHPRVDSPNTGWRNDSFRSFADYMQTTEFEQNLNRLIDLAGGKTVAIMCAEAVPWRCHRSLVADALIVRGLKVEHIIGQGARRPHEMTPWARVRGKTITYPTPSQS